MAQPLSLTRTRALTFSLSVAQTLTLSRTRSRRLHGSTRRCVTSRWRRARRRREGTIKALQLTPPLAQPSGAKLLSRATRHCSTTRILSRASTEKALPACGCTSLSMRASSSAVRRAWSQRTARCDTRWLHAGRGRPTQPPPMPNCFKGYGLSPTNAAAKQPRIMPSVPP